MKNNKTLYIVISVVIIVAVILLIVMSDRKDDLSKEFTSTKSDPAISNAIDSKFLDENNLERYENDQYGFSFLYPAEYSAGQFSEGSADVVLLQKTDEDFGLQISIAPWDEENERLTTVRIREDLPDLEINNPKDIELSGGKIDALIFTSGNTEFGSSVEVWFVNNGYLYQISTYEKLATLSQRVLETLRF